MFLEYVIDGALCASSNWIVPLFDRNSTYDDVKLESRRREDKYKLPCTQRSCCISSCKVFDMRVGIGVVQNGKKKAHLCDHGQRPMLASEMKLIVGWVVTYSMGEY